jgi:COP9 signalosome complex subunit 6
VGVCEKLMDLKGIELNLFFIAFMILFPMHLLICNPSFFSHSTMNELVDKFNTAYDRHSRRGGRTAFM